MVSRSLAQKAAIGVVAAALAVPATASAATLRGVVVHHNDRAHSFVVALAGGRLVAIHSRDRPGVGRTVRVSVRELRNGTFAARDIAIGRRMRHARISGVVTFVDRRRGEFTVSGDGASLLVHRSSDGQGMPAVGEDVTVSVGLEGQDDLQEQGMQTTGTQTSGIDLEGTILAVDTTARTLTLSADDEDMSGRSLTVDVPTTVDMSMFTVGQEVELTVVQQSDGTFLLQGAAGDDNQQQANNPGDQQGCTQDSTGGSGQTGGGDQSSGCSGDSGSSSGSGGGD